MYINIVGGSGFIGTRLCHRLNMTKKSFMIIDKAPSRSFPKKTLLGDVRFLNELREKISYKSILVNLAAEHRDDVRPTTLYDEVNVKGARNICVVAREKKINTIIFTSSVAVYGFAPVGTSELGEINPFNDYGRTKYEAENIYKAWQAEDPSQRTLVVIRPTVVFGEKNRGNVYNLLKQIASNRFVMVGRGDNIKSMAYVENLAAFLEYSMEFKPGVHTYNFVDEPNFTTGKLVSHVKGILGMSDRIRFKVPFILGFVIGKGFDFLSALSGKKFTISSIRIKKFCSNSVYSTNIGQTGYMPEVSLECGIEKTVRYEFIESHDGEDVFFTE